MATATKTTDNRDEVSLLMNKENALAIVSGKKKIETRTFSDYYIKRLFDIADGDNIKMKPIKRIRFHNYNNTWQLVVKVKTGGFCYLDKETIQEFNELYDFHDFDEMAKDIHADEIADENKDMFIWYELGEVIENNIAQFKK
jgi:hypothetical protein